MRLKKWVLYLLNIILISLLFYLLDKFNLIYINENKELIIDKIITLFGVYEILKANIKAIIKREEK